MKADLYHMNFQYLDFGEIDALDKFHNADVAVVDMSIHVQQASLFYHIGMRENMGMPETIILLNDTDPDFTLSVKVFSSLGDVEKITPPICFCFVPRVGSGAL